MKSGNRKFLEPSGPLQACNGTAANIKEVTGDCRISLILLLSNTGVIKVSMIIRMVHVASVEKKKNTNKFLVE
jgi:hypothetical protein